MTNQAQSRQGASWKANFLFLLFVLFVMHRACSPPDVRGSSAEMAPLYSVGEVFYDIAVHVNTPLNLTGRVQTSFYLGPIGGFFFLSDLKNDRTIICFTKMIPPADGAFTETFGVIRPGVLGSNVRMVYFKEKNRKVHSP